MKAERAFILIMETYLEGEPFTGAGKPHDLRRIYGSRGVVPDYVFRGRNTGRAVFVEIKRQRAAGNAHERACKFMMPGILQSMREIGNQPDDVIPFWWIFTDGIASDERYRKEIMHWFKGIESHVLLWEDVTDYKPVVDHFETHIRPLLT